MLEVQTYLNPNGQDPYAQWLGDFADRQARARVLVRVNRMAAGNFGDCKPIAEGVWELCFDWGPGYRVYYAQAGKRLVLLLAGGDKRTQQADIATALPLLTGTTGNSKRKRHEQNQNTRKPPA